MVGFRGIVVVTPRPVFRVPVKPYAAVELETATTEGIGQDLVASKGTRLVVPKRAGAMIENVDNFRHDVEMRIPLLADGNLSEAALEPDVAQARIAKVAVSLDIRIPFAPIEGGQAIAHGHFALDSHSGEKVGDIGAGTVAEVGAGQGGPYAAVEGDTVFLLFFYGRCHGLVSLAVCHGGHFLELIDLLAQRFQLLLLHLDGALEPFQGLIRVAGSLYQPGGKKAYCNHRNLRGSQEIRKDFHWYHSHIVILPVIIAREATPRQFPIQTYGPIFSGNLQA